MIEAGESDEVLGEFHKCFCTVTLRFQLFDGKKELHFEAINIRDQSVDIAKELERTVCQRILEVMETKAMLEKANGGKSIGVKALELEYKKHTKHGANNIVTDSFIEQAATVNKNLLSVPACREIMERFEDRYGAKHSLNNITILSSLVYRVKSSEHLQHIMAQLYDEVCHGNRSPTDMSKTVLLGKARDSKGYAEVCIRKLELSKLVHSKCVALGVTPDGLARMAEVMESHERFRAMCGSAALK
eukprot:631745-Pyramimonas_sp.AAC.1